MRRIMSGVSLTARSMFLFDETARDSSNESMFIADVLSTYCDEFDFIAAGSANADDSGTFNEGFYKRR